jgi:hypothetical protein
VAARVQLSFGCWSAVRLKPEVCQFAALESRLKPTARPSSAKVQVCALPITISLEGAVGHTGEDVAGVTTHKYRGRWEYEKWEEVVAFCLA